MEEKQRKFGQFVINYQNMGCNYSPKMHYVHCHLMELVRFQCQVSDEHDKDNAPNDEAFRAFV